MASTFNWRHGALANQAGSGRLLRPHPFGSGVGPSAASRTALIGTRADAACRNAAVRCTRELMRLIKEAGPWHFTSLAVEAQAEEGRSVLDVLQCHLAALKAERLAWNFEAECASERLGSKTDQVAVVVDECVSQAIEAKARAKARLVALASEDVEGSDTARDIELALAQAAIASADRLLKAAETYRADPCRDPHALRGLGFDHLLRARAPLVA
jgi:hypothetical protein